MFHIISSTANRQLNSTIAQLHDRSDSEKRRADNAEYRITQALELLAGQDSEQAAALLAVLNGDQ